VPYLFVNPRVGINHNFSEQTNAYLSLGYTSREPRLFHLYNGEQAWIGSKPEFEATLVNGTARYNFEKPLAKPERLLDLEIGGGYQTSRYKLSAHLYWMEFFDEIIKSGQLDIFGRPVTGNAERTRHIGLELVGRVQPLSNLSIDGNVTISHNKLVEYTEFDPTVGGFVSLNGNPIAGFPDLLANARVTYTGENVLISLWGRYVSAIYTDNRTLAHRRTDPYTVFDLDASYDVPFGSFATVTLRGKIRNLFNTLYLAGGDGDQFFPGAERNYFITLTLDF
jgi:iron complex outermembrane receptor protein